MIGGNYYMNLEWLPSPPPDFNDQLTNCLNEDSLEICIRELSSYGLNINQTDKLSRAIVDCMEDRTNFKLSVDFKLGIVSNTTSSFIIPSLIVSAARLGVLLKVIEAPYDQVMQVAYGENTAFEGEQLDAILVAIDDRGFPVNADSTVVSDKSHSVRESIKYIKSIRNKLSSRYNSPCILQTCPHHLESLFGSYDAIDKNTSRYFLDSFNRLLIDECDNGGDYLLDVSSISEVVGLANWHDPVMYNLAKLPFSHSVVPLYADHVCRIIASITGLTRRALVLDLDNTLWGGVIGDDGLSGITLGQGDPVGEAYIEFQKTIVKLHNRGIVLSISSKNDDHIARSPFREHPDMILEEDHISVFQASWVDKVSNIKAIAQKLNLGLGSLVFVDDNPLERDLVRKHLPIVAVPELPQDPAHYSQALMAAGYFEAVYFLDEDRNRAKSYGGNAINLDVQDNEKDISVYLHTLNMQSTICPFDLKVIKRITQLVSKSNQFNLTTYRYSERDLISMIDDSDYFTLQVRLRDKFADHGMVSVVVCKRSDDEWVIDLWIMSCRVLGRKLEDAVFNFVYESAKRERIKRIHGIYIPTERNNIVRDHYENLGFSNKGQADENGCVEWTIDINSNNANMCFEEGDSPITLIDCNDK